MGIFMIMITFQLQTDPFNVLLTKSTALSQAQQLRLLLACLPQIATCFIDFLRQSIKLRLKASKLKKRQQLMLEVLIRVSYDSNFRSVYNHNQMFSKILKTSIARTLLCNRAFMFSEKRHSIVPQQMKEKQEYRQKRSAYLNIALTCFVFAACFAGIPLYRTFCEHMGLIGDVDKKEYTFSDKKLNNLKKFKVSFTGYCDPDIKWEFEPVERELLVSAGETAIVFYKLYNKEEKAIVGFATYNISPEDCNVYFSKIQCFCFNQQLINPKEELLLPIFFYLQPQINDDQMVSRVKEIKVSYSFTKSAKQNLAKFAESQEKRIQENKRKLNQIRARKLNMTLEEYKAHLQEQQGIEQALNSKLKEETQKKQRQQELAELKRQQSFEEDLLKAEIISRETEEQFFVAKQQAM